MPENFANFNLRKKWKDDIINPSSLLSGDIGLTESFDAIWEQHMLQLQPCSHCARTFFPDRDVPKYLSWNNATAGAAFAEGARVSDFVMNLRKHLRILFRLTIHERSCKVSIFDINKEYAIFYYVLCFCFWNGTQFATNCTKFFFFLNWKKLAAFFMFFIT